MEVTDTKRMQRRRPLLVAVEDRTTTDLISEQRTSLVAVGIEKRRLFISPKMVSIKDLHLPMSVLAKFFLQLERAKE